ncbi:hypothetical protein MHYP_G00169620 [Metynnis hypsauchen]
MFSKWTVSSAFVQTELRRLMLALSPVITGDDHVSRWAWWALKERAKALLPFSERVTSVFSGSRSVHFTVLHS